MILLLMQLYVKEDQFLTRAFGTWRGLGSSSSTSISYRKDVALKEYLWYSIPHLSHVIHIIEWQNIICDYWHSTLNCRFWFFIKNFQRMQQSFHCLHSRCFQNFVVVMMSLGMHICLGCLSMWKKSWLGIYWMHKPWRRHGIPCYH